MAEFKQILTLQTESGQSVSIDLRNALILSTAPTTATAARAGMQAYVVSGGTITAEYVCTAVSGSTYTWVKREISGGSGGGVFTATYNSTPYSEILAAHTAGQWVMLIDGNFVYTIAAVTTGTIIFQNVQGVNLRRITLSSGDEWIKAEYEVQLESDKVTSIDETSTDDQYPSAKAVYDYSAPKYFGTENAKARLVVGDDGFVKTEFPTAKVTGTGDYISIFPLDGTTISVVTNIDRHVDGEYSNILTLNHTNGGSVIDLAGMLKKRFGTTFTQGGLTGTINDDDTLTVTGTVETSGEWLNFAEFITEVDGDIVQLPPGTYTFGNGIVMAAFTEDPETGNSWVGNGNKNYTFNMDTSFRLYNFYIPFRNGETVNFTTKLTLMRGSTIPEDGYQYNGNYYEVRFSQKIGSGTYNWQTGELRDANGTIVETLTPIEPFDAYGGKNIIYSCFENEVTYFTIGDSSTNNEILGGGAEAFDPEAWGLPVLYLSGSTASMSKDNAVNLSYEYQGRKGTCSVKWQGSSSLSYEKKNYTIKFDTAFEAKEGWGEQTKYCLKANFIDHTHARNVCNAKLWGQIVKSRDTVPSVFANLPNAGAVDGFPMLIVLNGKFHGLYTWNIPKDGWMMGMGNGSSEAIICADKWVDATGFKGTALVDGTDFKLEYASDEDNAGWVATSLNRLINACIASNGSNLDTTVAQYMDWDSAIDYYIFTVLTEGADMTQKNYLLVTFDGTKWYFSAYDMDSTHGLHWNGGSFLPADNQPTFVSYANIHRVMELIKTYKKDALKERYNELRSGVLSESNLATVFNNFVGAIPAPVYTEEENIWTGVPNTSVNNVSQIRDYYRMRVAYADKWIDNL